MFKAERTSSSKEYSDPSASAQKKAPFRLGESYRIATLQLDTDATTVSAGTIDGISYTLGSDAIDSFFVQAKSGDIFGTFPRADSFSFDVLAVDQNGVTAVVETLKFEVLGRPVTTLLPT